MRAAVFHEVGSPLSIETVPDPRPETGQVIIEVSHCGICGSDLHWTETDGMVPPGMILGHEFAGTIADANSTSLSVGTRVTALPICPCWNCHECRDGHLFHCTNPVYIGLATPGAYAHALAVDAKLVQPLPAGIDFPEGALIEPLAVGYRTVSHAREIQGANVLVLGAGPIGLGVSLFAGLSGARKVVSSEPSDGRRRMALTVGASAAINPREEDVAARFAEICGGPPDIVIECVGISGTFTEATRLVRHRGQVISAGGSYNVEDFLPIDALMKELTVNFSLAYEITDFEAVIDTVAREGISPQPLITDTISLDELPVKFEALRRPSTQCKVLVEMR